jgi:hypothetical protein
MKSMLSTLRFFLTVCLCAVLMFSFVVSSASALPFKNEPMKNEAGEVAKEYESTAKDAIDRGGLQSLEEVRDRSKGGAPNEIQGTTGIDEMKRPSNTQGESIEGQIKKGLDKAKKSID